MEDSYVVRMSRAVDVGRWFVRVSVGRVTVRTWCPFAVVEPARYRESIDVWLVQYLDPRDGVTSQLGAFDTEQEAKACLAVLERDGWRDLEINHVIVHRAVRDWQRDR